MSSKVVLQKKNLSHCIFPLSAHTTSKIRPGAILSGYVTLLGISPLWKERQSSHRVFSYSSSQHTQYGNSCPPQKIRPARFGKTGIVVLPCFSSQCLCRRHLRFTSSFIFSPSFMKQWSWKTEGDSVEHELKSHRLQCVAGDEIVEAAAWKSQKGWDCEDTLAVLVVQWGKNSILRSFQAIESFLILEGAYHSPVPWLSTHQVQRCGLAYLQQVGSDWCRYSFRYVQYVWMLEISHSKLQFFLNSKNLLELDKYQSEGNTLPLVFATLPRLVTSTQNFVPPRLPWRVAVVLEENNNLTTLPAVHDILAPLQLLSLPLYVRRYHARYLKKWSEPPKRSTSGSLESNLDPSDLSPILREVASFQQSQMTRKWIWKKSLTI